MAVATLYQFVADVPSSRWPAHISIVRAVDAYSYFSRTELSEVFGGMAKYEDMQTGEEWVGIWGARKASKFRRLLRERGATLVTVKSNPASLRLKVASYGQSLDTKGRS